MMFEESKNYLKIWKVNTGKLCSWFAFDGKHVLYFKRRNFMKRLDEIMMSLSFLEGKFVERFLMWEFFINTLREIFGLVALGRFKFHFKRYHE